MLASRSPRRLDLLRMVGVGDLRVIPDDAEEVLVHKLSPEETVGEIALTKAKNVSRLCNKDDIIIAADTLVYLDGKPIGKPIDKADAAVILKSLSGKRHVVYTGVVLLKDGVHVSETEITYVYFRDISDEEISAYIETGEPMDKAGAYAAQGRAAVFVRRIEGDFFNVMGLPLCRLNAMLKTFGYYLSGAF